MKKWTGHWLECRIHCFWSVHSKGPSWQLTQRPLQKNRSLTLTTVWGENVSGPEHCQNPPRCCLQLLKRNEERNREQKRGERKRDCERKRDMSLVSVFGWSGARWVALAGNISATKTPIEKRGGRAQNTQTKSHDDRHIFFPSEWFSLSNSAQQGFLKVLKFWSQTACVHCFSEFTVRANLIKKNTAERFSLPINYFFNAFEICHIRAQFMTVIRCVLWTLEDRTLCKI